MAQTLHAIFADQDAAAQAIERLAALGISRDAIRTIADVGPHHVGSFADSGDHAHTPERDHVGSFADSGDHAHTPERDHVGSFADVERGARQTAGVAATLQAAGMPAAEAAAAARRVGAGSVLVLVRAQPELAEVVSSALAGRG